MPTRLPKPSPFICRRCLHARRAQRSRRPYSSTTAAASATPPSPPPSGIAHLTNRRLVSLAGRDAPKFLQGLTTNDVSPARTQGWFCAFLNAQGRVLWDALVYPWRGASEGAGERGEGDWACLIEVDAGEVKGLLGHLKRHKLRSKVRIREVEEGEVGVYAAWREGESGCTGTAGDAADSMSAYDRSGGSSLSLALPDPRVPGFGHRLLIPSSPGSSSTAPSNAPGFEGLPPANLTAYTLRRYLHGLAEGPHEMPPQAALPLESNIDYMSGVDFRKGCYVGQELTIRTHHTGVVRKRILPAALYAPGAGAAPAALAYDATAAAAVALPPAGAEIRRVEGRGRGAGRWIAGVGNVGLALCRLEMMTDVRVSAEGGGWTPGMEFKIGWGEDGGAKEEVGVKAFVPEWHRGKERVRGAPRRALEE